MGLTQYNSGELKFWCTRILTHQEAAPVQKWADAAGQAELPRLWCRLWWPWVLPGGLPAASLLGMVLWCWAGLVSSLLGFSGCVSLVIWWNGAIMIR